MYGVGSVRLDYGGGGGYYEGGVCRKVNRWWNGLQWQETPVDEGPFPSPTQAQDFAEACKREYPKTHFFTYESGDPWGENPLKSKAVG